jgi:hypothetical protein
MILHPAVIVHGLADADSVLAKGAPVTLLSAPGAALYGGCLWWRELVRAARLANPKTQAIDVLDCADASGMAMAAVRSGVIRLVLWPAAPNRGAVGQIAEQAGGFVLDAAPVALDMKARNAARRLRDWLVAGDSQAGSG